MPSEAGSTFYRGVCTIAPGHLLVIEPNRRKITRFWSLESIRQIRYSKDSDYVEAFNALNHPNWSNASSNPTSGSFGFVTDKTGERVIQLATKYSF